MWENARLSFFWTVPLSLGILVFYQWEKGRNTTEITACFSPSAFPVNLKSYVEYTSASTQYINLHQTSCVEGLSKCSQMYVLLPFGNNFPKLLLCVVGLQTFPLVLSFSFAYEHALQEEDFVLDLKVKGLRCSKGTRRSTCICCRWQNGNAVCNRM